MICGFASGSYDKLSILTFYETLRGDNMKKITVLFLVTLSILFIGCEEKPTKSVEVATEQIKDKTKDAVEKIKDESKEMTQKSTEAVEHVADTLKEATDKAAREAKEATEK